MALVVKQTTSDIWDLHAGGYHVVIPTNLFVKGDGGAVMGRGLARQAKERFPNVEYWYGFHLKEHVRKTPEARNPRLEDINPSGLISVNNEWRAVFLPVKTSWNQQARKTLIAASLVNLAHVLNMPILKSAMIALPRIGCGNGGLDWATDVKPLVRPFLESLDEDARSRVCIVHPPADLPVEAAGSWQ